MSTPKVSLNSTPTTYEYWGYQIPYPPNPGPNGGFLPAPNYPATPASLQTSYLYTYFPAALLKNPPQGPLHLTSLPEANGLAGQAELAGILASFPGTFGVASSLNDIPAKAGTVVFYRMITANYYWTQQWAANVPSNAPAPETGSYGVTSGVTSGVDENTSFSATLGIELGADWGPVSAKVSVALQWSSSVTTSMSWTSEETHTTNFSTPPGYTQQVWTVVIAITSESVPTMQVPTSTSSTLTYADFICYTAQVENT